MRIEEWTGLGRLTDTTDALVGGGGMFSHVSVKTLEAELDLITYMHHLVTDVTETARDYANEIYYRLKEEYEWMLSDEYITEMCEANEYEFDEKGEMVWVTEAQ
jgi:hypothetical protein